MSIIHGTLSGLSKSVQQFYKSMQKGTVSLLGSITPSMETLLSPIVAHKSLGELVKEECLRSNIVVTDDVVLTEVAPGVYLFDGFCRYHKRMIKYKAIEMNQVIFIERVWTLNYYPTYISSLRTQ